MRNNEQHSKSNSSVRNIRNSKESSKLYEHSNKDLAKKNAKSKSSKTASARANTRTNKITSTATSKRANTRFATKSRSNTNAGAKNRNQNRKQHKKHPIILWMIILFTLFIAIGLLLFAYLYYTTEIPQPYKIAMADKTKVYYSDGKTEIGSFAEQNREIINCSILPKYVGNAIVASENRSFYKDNGIDFKGIGRALIHNVTKRKRWGGSTITQQYAERYYLGETKTYIGKLHEAILALKISQTQDKSTVLCNYMNTIYLGRGAYGIQAASKAYFGVDAKDLTLAQSALLAGIIPAPSSWDPAVGNEEAQSRFNRVLKIMEKDGYITSKEREKTKFPKTLNQKSQNIYAGPNGYILHMVREELTKSKAFSKEDLDTGGYRIITTIDKNKQNLMFKVASPSQSMRKILPQGIQVGSISINPKNGSIISIYAGDDYVKKPLNNVTQALYEPGSTMKPFALMGAIQAGMNLNTLFNGDSPIKFDGIKDPVKNFSNISYGNIDMYQATAKSVNTPYMALQQKLGRRVIAQTAVAAGLSPKRVTGENPFTVLGNDNVHVSEIAQAYSTFANKGNRPDLHIVSSVKNSENRDVYTTPITLKQVFSPNNAALASKAMLGTVDHGTATEVKKLGRPMAGKSGTANDQTAVSFIGFAPNVVTVFALWYPDCNGNPQVIPTFRGGFGLSGSSFPVHLFTIYMKNALKDVPVEDFPDAKDNGKIGGPDGTWGLGSQITESADDNKDNSDSKSNDSKNSDSKDSKDSKDDKDDKDNKGDKANKDNNGTKDSKDTKNSKDNSDTKNSKSNN